MRPVTVERRELEFLGIDDVTVELVDGFGPCVGAEVGVVHAKAATLLILIPAIPVALETRHKEGKNALPRRPKHRRVRGRKLVFTIHAGVDNAEIRCRAIEPPLELVLPFPEEPFPDDAPDICVVNGIAEVVFDVWEGKGVGIVPWEGAEAFRDQEAVPY